MVVDAAHPASVGGNQSTLWLIVVLVLASQVSSFLSNKICHYKQEARKGLGSALLIGIQRDLTM